MKIKIKKASIEIIVEGCIECGIRWSSGWAVARVVPVKIGSREGSITLHICADCQHSPKQAKKAACAHGLAQNGLIQAVGEGIAMGNCE